MGVILVVTRQMSIDVENCLFQTRRKVHPNLLAVNQQGNLQIHLSFKLVQTQLDLAMSHHQAKEGAVRNSCYGGNLLSVMRSAWDFWFSESIYLEFNNKHVKFSPFLPPLSCPRHHGFLVPQQEYLALILNTGSYKFILSII
jgi:hypothetical protein